MAGVNIYMANFTTLKTVNTNFIGFAYASPISMDATNWAVQIDWGDGKVETLSSSRGANNNYYNQDGLGWDRDNEVPEEGSIPLNFWHVYDDFGIYTIKIKGGFNLNTADEGTIISSNGSFVAINPGTTPAFCETRPIVEEIIFGDQFAKCFLKLQPGAFKGFSSLKKIHRPSSVKSIGERQDWIQLADFWLPTRGNQDRDSLTDGSLSLAEMFSGCSSLEPITEKKIWDDTFLADRSSGVADVLLILSTGKYYKNKIGNLAGLFEDCTIFGADTTELHVQKVTDFSRCFKGVRSNSSKLHGLLGKTRDDQISQTALKGPEQIFSCESMFEGAKLQDPSDFIPGMELYKTVNMKKMFKDSEVDAYLGLWFKGADSLYETIDAESIFEGAKMPARPETWPNNNITNPDGTKAKTMLLYWSGFRPSNLKRAFKNCKMVDKDHPNDDRYEVVITGLHKWVTKECTSLEETFMGAYNIFQSSSFGAPLNHDSIRDWNVYKVESFRGCFAYCQTKLNITNWFVAWNSQFHGNGGAANTVYNSNNIDLFYNGSDCSYMFAYWNQPRSKHKKHNCGGFRGLRPSTTEGMFAQEKDKKNQDGSDWNYIAYSPLADFEFNLVNGFGAWRERNGVDVPGDSVPVWKNADFMFAGCKSFTNTHNYWGKSWNVSSLESARGMFAHTNSLVFLETWFNPNESRNSGGINIKNIDFMFDGSDHDLQRVKLWAGGMSSVISMNGTFRNALNVDLSQVGQWFYNETSSTALPCNVERMFGTFQGTVNNYNPEQKSGMGLTRFKRYFSNWELPNKEIISSNFNVHAFLRASNVDSLDNDYGGTGREYEDGFKKINGEGSTDPVFFTKNITKDSVITYNYIYPPITASFLTIEDVDTYLQSLLYCTNAYPATIYDTIYTNLGVGVKNI